MKEFSIIEQLNEVQIKQLHNLLQQMWWSRERSFEEVLTMLKTSMSFGLIENATQNLVGYARVLTDEIKYAFIFDVMLVEQCRGKGLGKVIVDAVIAHPRLQNIKRFELTCAEDMVQFYERFGFSEDYGKAKPMILKKQAKNQHNNVHLFERVLSACIEIFLALGNIGRRTFP